MPIATLETYRAVLDGIIETTVTPNAVGVDRDAAFPAAAIEALGEAGLLGLVTAPEMGGLGGGMPEAADVIEQLARACGSTAMVVCMHYAAAAFIEALGPEDVRREVAAGRHLSTLAFSETGSRSHFWAPLSTAAPDGNGNVRLDAHKSWATSAGHVQSYVWSSKGLDGDDVTLWLVPADRPGLTVAGGFDGLGLRGNASSPVTAEGTMIPGAAMLGEDGKGFDLMLQIAVPYFHLMSAAASLGLMEAAVGASIAHASGARFEHLDASLASLPTIRAYIARMRIRTDAVRALLQDTLAALAAGRDDAVLRLLEVKAFAADSAIEVTDTAMRVCGGAAFRKEVGIERAFRDARASAVMAPTSDVLYDLIGRAVCGLPLFE